MSASTHFAGSAAHWQAGRLRAAAGEFGKAIVDEFLHRYLKSQQQILAAERKEYRRMPTKELAGQIQYHNNQVSTIKWLISINSQRKPDGRNPDESSTTGGKSA